jgi:hypothetical protein
MEVAESKFLGSIFPYMEDGLEYTVCFDCKEELDTEVGITVASVHNITVVNYAGEDMKDKVNMIKVEKICYRKASDAIMRKMPPGLNDN